jgi:hypothetical protein
VANVPLEKFRCSILRQSQEIPWNYWNLLLILI